MTRTGQGQTDVRRALQRLAVIFAEHDFPDLRALLGPEWDDFREELQSILARLDTLPTGVVIVRLLPLLRRYPPVQEALETYIMGEFPELQPLATILPGRPAVRLEETQEAAEPLESAGPAAKGMEPASYVNFTYTDLDPLDRHELGLHEGFRSDAKYKLEVGITGNPDARFGGDEESQPQIEWPETSHEPITLHVAVFSKDDDIEIEGDALDTLEWVPGRSLKNAEFVLRAAKTDEKRSGMVEVYFFYKANLLYIARHEITIMPDDHDWQEDERPITWVHREDEDRRRSLLFKRFAAVQQRGERALCLAITPGAGKDEFTITALLGRAELPARVQMTRAELDSHLVTIRGLLDELRRTREYIDGGYDAQGEYVGAYVGGAGVYDAGRSPIDAARVRKAFDGFMKKAAKAGQRFWDDLNRTRSFRELAQVIGGHVRDGDVIQVWIDSQARDFVYPWVWLHTPAEQRPLQEGFWGYRYVIEQLPQYDERAAKQWVANEIPSEDGLKVKVGVFMFNQADNHQTENQKRFFADCASRSGQALDYEVWHRRTQWEEFLPQCDSEVLYFFTHGHTAKPRTWEGLQFDQFYDTLLTGWREWLAEPVEGESESMKEYRQRGLDFMKQLEDEDLLAETFIRLASGYLTLPRLRAMDLDRSSPLVFLNLCESAQVFPTISEGLVEVFLKNGARGVIGTEMPMIPHFADLFSRRFFERFFYEHGEPGKTEDVGQILLDLRRHYLDQGNPLGFAYVLFGDATTHLSKSLPVAE